MNFRTSWSRSFVARRFAGVVAIAVPVFLGGCVAPHVLLPTEGKGLDELGVGSRATDAHVADSCAGPARVVRVGADARAPVVVVATDASMVSGSERLDLGLLAEQLCAAGFETLIVDYPARDGSTKRGFERLPASRQRAAANLVAGLAGERPVVVRGTSLGTTFVARLVEAGVDVRGAALVAPISPPRLVHAAAREILGFPLGDVAAWLHATPQLHAPVELTELPLHVVIARDDPFLSARDLERLRTRGAPWTVVESEHGHEMTALLGRCLYPGEVEFLARSVGIESDALRRTLAAATRERLNESSAAWLDDWIDDCAVTASDLACHAGAVHLEWRGTKPVHVVPLKPSDLEDSADWWREQWRMSLIVGASGSLVPVMVASHNFVPDPLVAATDGFGSVRYSIDGFFEDHLEIRHDFDELRRRVEAVRGPACRAWVLHGMFTLIRFDVDVTESGLNFQWAGAPLAVPFVASDAAGPTGEAILGR